MSRNGLSRRALAAVFNFRPRVKVIILGLLFLLSAELQFQILAAPINVDSGCSLANAIRSANGDTQVSPQANCAAGSAAGVDIINLPETAGTLTLTEALPAVDSSITLNGNGWTISGDAKFRVFYQFNGVFTVNDLTITKGAGGDGGAVLVSGGTFNLNQSTISDSVSKTGHGGAIHSLDTVNISRSVFSNNSAGDSNGGAIYSHGFLTVSRSAFYGNNASSAGYGGAIATTAFSNGMRVANSTFYNNRAELGGAIYVGGGETVLTHLTINGNSASATNGGGGGGGGGGSTFQPTLMPRRRKAKRPNPFAWRCATVCWPATAPMTVSWPRARQLAIQAT